MFYLRLDKVIILNISGLNGDGDIQLMSIISGQIDEFQMMLDFYRTDDETAKLSLIKEAVKRIYHSATIIPSEKNWDKQVFTFGDNGFYVINGEKIPDDFCWILLAINQDNSDRNNSHLMKELLTIENLKKFKYSVETLSNLKNPVPSAINKLTEMICSVLAGLSENDNHQQIGMYMGSFIKRHYPNGIRKKEGISDRTGNMFLDYSVFSHQKKTF